MNQISIEDIEPGMILASDIRTPQGRLVLNKGTTLAVDHLRIFKIWNITAVSIEGSSKEQVVQSKIARLNPGNVLASGELAAEIFSHANKEHEAVHELMNIFIARTAEKMAQFGKQHVLKKDFNFFRTTMNFPGTLEQNTISINDILAENITLVSLPDIFFEIMEALNSRKTSAAYLADIISRDASMTAKLLRLVNSAIYGLPRHIDSLSTAITMIGSQQLSNLALGISVTGVFRNIPAELIDMERFWKHSLATGVISKCLAGHLFNMDEERFSVAGLLHDFGRLVMMQNYPGMSARVISQARTEKRLLYEVEQETWGFDHSRLAGELFHHWNFPLALQNSVHFHHAPQEPLVESSVVHLADVIAHALVIGSSGTYFVPPLAPKAWEAIQLSPSSLSSLTIQAESQVKELMPILF